MTKHPQAVALDTWLASHEGRDTADGVTSGVYLENRLKRAFAAGWDAAVEAMAQSAGTERPRKLKRQLFDNIE